MLKPKKKRKLKKSLVNFHLSGDQLTAGRYLVSICMYAGVQTNHVEMQSIDFGKQANNNFKITKYTHTLKYTYELTKRINGPTDTEA